MTEQLKPSTLMKAPDIIHARAVYSGNGFSAMSRYRFMRNPGSGESYTALNDNMHGRVETLSSLMHGAPSAHFKNFMEQPLVDCWHIILDDISAADTLDKQRPEKLPELGYFIGTENYYRSPYQYNNTILLYTDGVKHVFETAQAYWLRDVIFTHTISIYSNTAIPAEQKRLLVCNLAVGSNDAAIFAIEDGNGNVLAAQEIEYTDFPAQSVTIWVQNGVAMLPSEY